MMPFKTITHQGLPAIAFGSCALASIDQHGNIATIAYDPDAPDIAEIAELAALLRASLIPARPIWRQTYQTYGNATSNRRRDFLRLLCAMTNSTWNLINAPAAAPGTLEHRTQ